MNFEFETLPTSDMTSITITPKSSIGQAKKYSLTDTKFTLKCRGSSAPDISST